MEAILLPLVSSVVLSVKLFAFNVSWVYGRQPEKTGTISFIENAEGGYG